MGVYTAAGIYYVEVGSVVLYCKYCVAGAGGDAVVGVGGKVIKELEHVPVFVVGG